MTEEYRAYGYRWVVLAVFCLIMGVQAIQWLNFAPVETSVETVLGVSPFLIRILALSGSLISALLMPFAGSFSDRHGFKMGTGLGVILLLVAALIKGVSLHLFSDPSTRYAAFLLAQVMVGLAGAFTFSNLSKMPSRWFPVKQRAFANGMSAMGMYLGIALGLPLIAWFSGIPESADLVARQQGLERMLLITGLIMAGAALLFFLLVRENPPTPAGPDEELESSTLRQTFPGLVRIGNFRALMLISFFGYGIYIGLTVTMEKIILFHGEGFTTGLASMVAGLITAGGILGSLVLPSASEKVGLRKPFIATAAAVSVPMVLVIGLWPSIAANISGAIILGFFILPTVPIMFTVAGEMKEIGPRLASTATGTLMATGNIGGVLIALLMEVLSRPGGDYRLSVVLLSGCALGAMLVAIIRLKETGPRSRPGS